MSLRKRFALFLLLVLGLAGLAALLAPFCVAHGVRLWLGWAAKKQALQITLEKIEAPFLRPVIIRGLRLSPAPGRRRQIDLQVAALEADLNLRGWLFGSESPLLQTLAADRITARVRIPDDAAGVRELDWNQLAQLLPENFRIEDLHLEVTTASASFNARGLKLNGSAIEAGEFFASRIFVVSPLLRQTFSDLRGASSWEGARLTIAGIPLVPGLDLEALTIDLSHLGKRRLGADLQLDTYGGTLRASVEGRARQKFTLEAAGSASNLSLAQISRALGFIEPVSGAVRASRFTFRGNPGEFLDATASIWMELTEFNWRSRRADNVMLGATYYGRRLELDQLYVRQRQNELTVQGELLWPREPWRGAQLPFRGRLNATIPDLNGFAQLFGATTGDFTGALRAEGELDSSAAESQGRLQLQGEKVTFRGVALDSLGATLRLAGSEATIETLEARRAQDFLRADGTFDLAAPHRFSGRLTGALEDLAIYAPLLPAAWRPQKIGGGATFDWRGDGTRAAHSGTVQFFAHGLQLPVALLRTPLDVSLEGSYSPRDFFFRTFKVANDRVSLGGFLLLGQNFVELQALQLALDGRPRVTGSLFLPVGLNLWRTSGSLLAAFAPEQKFDVDLLLEQLDLGGLGNALGEESSLTGVLDGKLAAFGPLAALQITTNLRLENIGSFRSANSIDFEGRYAEGRADAEATAVFGVSAPVRLRASLPLRLEKAQLAAGAVVDPVKPFSLEVNCPALFIDDLPDEFRHGATRGLLTGAISFSSNLRAPRVSGEARLLDAQFRPPPPWPAVDRLTAGVRFTDRTAVVDLLQVESNATPSTWHGHFSMGERNYGLTLAPEESIEFFELPAAPLLSSIRMLGADAKGGGPRLEEAFFRGQLGGTSSLTVTAEIDGSSQRRTFWFDEKAAGGSPLLLRVLSSPRHADLRLDLPGPSAR